MLATLLAALPLLALVAFSAFDRYDADRERAETRATNRAELITGLLAEADAPGPPSAARLDEVLRLGTNPSGTAVVVYAGGREVVRAGDRRAGPPVGDREADAALARRAGVFNATGTDGVRRVWGVRRLSSSELTLAFGLPGSAVYGPAQSALRRDLLLATLSVVIVLVASFLLAGRVTAPIRRLAARVATDDDEEAVNEIGAIERGMMHQVNERSRLEDQLRQAHKLESIGLLAGGVAHDFNNLLTVITGYGELARNEVQAGPGAESLTEIARAAERASQLTHQLLAFARKQTLEPVTLDLSEVLRDVTPMLGRLIGEDVRVVTLLADDLPPVLADHAQIEQVIMNLALNARDAMLNGGTLTVETRAEVLGEDYTHDHAVEPGLYVCVTVTDTGSGIGPEQLEHIFEPFYTTKEVGRGTGLGLATVHGIVNQSGGHVQVYSEPAFGTTFKVYLPAAETRTRSTATEQPATPPRTGTETVLLCEDDDDVRRLIERILTDGGYRVLSSAHPQAAIDIGRAHESRIDLLLSDVILPQMPGPELARRLQAILPGVPALFLSGYTFETVRDRGSLPPGSAFLEKPFHHDTLLQHVRDLLDQQLPGSQDAGRGNPAGGRNPAA
jgi:signal transduction histidine kinase/CheY-like chemotaxis protein